MTTAATQLQGAIQGAMSEAEVRLIIQKLAERQTGVIERRSAERIEVGLPVETSILRGQLFTPLGEAWLENISEGGLGLLTDRPPAKSSLLRIGFGSLFKDKFLFCQVGRVTRKLERAYGVGARIIHSDNEVKTDSPTDSDATPEQPEEASTED